MLLTKGDICIEDAKCNERNYNIDSGCDIYTRFQGNIKT